MIVNHESLQTIFTGFKRNFQAGFAGVTPAWTNIATEVPSSTERELYGWLEDAPGMREWFGPREVKNLNVENYTIINRLFEDTIGVERTKIEDDTFGTYSNRFQLMGEAAARHVDEIIFEETLLGGDVNVAYDGSPFFSTTHTVQGASVSNNDTSAGTVSTKWFLMDTTRALKPLIYQNRMAPEFVNKESAEGSDHVFLRDQFLMGTRARRAAGYGFWQMAYQSIGNMNETNLDTYIADMMSQESENGKKLGVMPNLIVCGPSRRAEALTLLKREVDANGASNRSFGVVGALITPYLP